MSKIEWTEKTWNPVRGCSKVSPGCKHCFAETFAERFRGVPGHPYEQGFDLRLVPEKLSQPLRWRKPRLVFVNSMSDLFHEDVPDEYIDRVFATMALAGPAHPDWAVVPGSTFQLLTKRAERARRYLCEKETPERIAKAVRAMDVPSKLGGRWQGEVAAGIAKRDCLWWPLPGLWLGVSVENQPAADERIPLLLQAPAAVRFVSAEPLLRPVDLSRYMGLTWVYSAGGAGDMPDDPPRLDWVIVGGESGPRARPFDVEWARSIVGQCRAAEVPCFVKQLGAHAEDSRPPGGAFFVLRHPKGGDPSEWPEDLRVRQMPGGAR